MTKFYLCFIRAHFLALILIIQFGLGLGASKAWGAHESKMPDLTAEEINNALTVAYLSFLGRSGADDPHKADLLAQIQRGDTTLWKAIDGIIGQSKEASQKPRDNAAAIENAYSVFLRRADKGAADPNRQSWIDRVNKGELPLHQALEEIWRAPEARGYRDETRKTRGLKAGHPYGDKPEHATAIFVGHTVEALHKTAHAAKTGAAAVIALGQTVGWLSETKALAAPHGSGGVGAKTLKTSLRALTPIGIWYSSNQQLDHEHDRTMAKIGFETELEALERAIRKVGNRKLLPEKGEPMDPMTIVAGLKEMRDVLDREKPSTGGRAKDIAKTNAPFVGLVAHNDSAIKDQEHAIVFFKFTEQMRALRNRLEPLGAQEEAKRDAEFKKNYLAKIYEKLHCVVYFTCGQMREGGATPQLNPKKFSVEVPMYIQPTTDDPTKELALLASKSCVDRTKFYSMLDVSVMEDKFRGKPDKEIPLALRAMKKAKEECLGELDFAKPLFAGFVGPVSDETKAKIRAKADVVALDQGVLVVGNLEERMRPLPLGDYRNYRATLPTHYPPRIDGPAWVPK